MERINYTEARAMKVAGCFSFISEGGNRSTAIMPSGGAIAAIFDERMFVPALCVQAKVDGLDLPSLTATVYL